MTQPVSNGARWSGADFTRSEPSGEDSETLTCEEPPSVSRAEEQAHRAETTAPARDAGTDGNDTATVAAPAADVLRHGDVPPEVGFCARADTVVEGFLCNDPLTVSNACRKPTNAFDEFVCDDPKMQRLQWAIVRETWSIVKAIGLTLVRGRP
jgi:hypothetical protein